MLSKPRIGWPRIFMIMLHQTYGLLTHQTIPLDYYVWGVVEKEVNKHPHNTKSSLMEAMEDINKNHLIRACSLFQTGIESVIEAKGGYIE